MNTEIIINDKISLKIPELADALNIYNAVDKDRSHLKTFLAWVDKTNSVKDVEENVLKRIEQFKNKESASFIIYYENNPMGSVGFISLDTASKQGEIGYWINSNFEGKGIMTECVKASIEYGFKELDLNKIVITCNSENSKSASIPKRFGFTNEAIL